MGFADADFVDSGRLLITSFAQKSVKGPIEDNFDLENLDEPRVRFFWIEEADY
jgi:hypothetical protein